MYGHAKRKLVLFYQNPISSGPALYIFTPVPVSYLPEKNGKYKTINQRGTVCRRQLLGILTFGGVLTEHCSASV